MIRGRFIFTEKFRRRRRRGRTINGAMAACVYITSRAAKIPRTINEVARTTNITRKEVSNAYIAIVLGLNLRFH